MQSSAKLDNSIISRHTTVEEKCSVKDCEAATGVTLASGGSFRSIVNVWASTHVGFTGDYKGERIEQFETDDDTADDVDATGDSDEDEDED